MGINADIKKGISDYLIASGITNVAWPNVEYTKVYPYYRVNFLPAPNVPLGIASGDIHGGILQIDVVYTSSTGEIKATTLVDSLLALFPRNKHIIEGTTTIEFLTTGSPAPAIPESNGFFIPVSFNYMVLN